MTLSSPFPILVLWLCFLLDFTGPEETQLFLGERLQP